MNRIVLNSVGKKITDNDFLTLEKFINGVIPQDYRNFLTNNNGGYIANGYYILDYSNIPLLIEYFFGINHEDSSYDLIYHLQNIRINRYPKGYIPIGGDGGNSFLLGVYLNNSDYGKIYFWDHENENPYEGEDPWMENMYLVANSFTEFMEKIHPDEE